MNRGKNITREIVKRGVKGIGLLRRITHIHHDFPTGGVGDLRHHRVEVRQSGRVVGGTCPEAGVRVGRRRINLVVSDGSAARRKTRVNDIAGVRVRGGDKIELINIHAQREIRAADIGHQGKHRRQRDQQQRPAG